MTSLRPLKNILRISFYNIGKYSIFLLVFFVLLFFIIIVIDFFFYNHVIKLNEFIEHI